MLLATANLAINPLSFSVIFVKKRFIFEFHEFLKIFFVFSDNIHKLISSHFNQLCEFRAHHVHCFVSAC